MRDLIYISIAISTSHHLNPLEHLPRNICNPYVVLIDMPEGKYPLPRLFYQTDR